MSLHFKYIASILTLCLTLLPDHSSAAEENVVPESPPPSLSMPIECDIGKDCFIQNYVDHANGPAYKDYTCGSLSYNDHKGTDFRLINLKQMRKGVTVIAAAPGVVKGIRTTMPDQAVTEETRAILENRECGNGVLLFHEGEWQTQYCHMRQDSIVVQPGDKVEAGQPLGKVGLSGLTEFPHLHFMVRNGDVVIDPFTAGKMESPCITKEQGPSLWNAETLEKLAYVPTAILDMGFTPEVPNAEGVQEGQFNEVTIDKTSKTVLFWTEVIGLQPGDQAIIKIVSPEGIILVIHDDKFEKSRARQFTYIGKKRGDDLWMPGSYTGHYTLIRNKQEALTVSKTVTIK